MGGGDRVHSGKATYSSSGWPTHSAGTFKWSYTIPGSATSITGMAIGEVSGEEYDVYFGASDHKLHSVHVTYSGGAFSTSQNWTYSIPGSADMIGTPSLAVDSNANRGIVFSDTAGVVHCVDDGNHTQTWSYDVVGNFGGASITATMVVGATIYVGIAGNGAGALVVLNNDGSLRASVGVDEDLTGTPAVAEETDDQGDAPITTYIYITCPDGKLDKFMDQGQTDVTYEWTYTPPGGSQFCDTWASLGSRTKIYYATYENSPSNGVVLGCDDTGADLWPDNSNHRVDVTRDNTVPSVDRTFGVLANLANDRGGTPTIWQMSSNYSTTLKPCYMTIADLSESTGAATSYVRTKMGSSSDNITSTPVYAYDTNNLSADLAFITTTGKFYLANPGGAGVVQGFPKSLSLTVPKQNLALDHRGALVFGVTSGGTGYIKAYWGR